MNFEQLIENLDADIYQRLKTAVELGKWPNGERLTEGQKASSMQAVIAYENKHLPPEERTGYVESACRHNEEKIEEDAPLRWK